MGLRLYNTAGRDKQAFVPQDPERVTLYVCGPTVYGYAHIGNARPVVVFDLLFRVLRHLYGPEAVIYARNVTDVDDKINAEAAAEGVPISVITERYLAAYHTDMDALGALRPTLEPRATDHIEAIQTQIGQLISRGSAYEAEGHVLFDTQSFSDYGEVSKRPLDDMIAGARVDVAPYKRHAADFVLWKPSKPEEPVWDSPWGAGRPGWHIECSAMVDAQLGLPIDIHGGGIDLQFPHHENESAQGRCAHGVPVYAHYWMHNGFLDMAGEKMSKSLGNVVVPHDLLTTVPGEVLRWALLSAHYRQPLDWTEDLIEQSRKALDRLYGALLRVKLVDHDPVAVPEAVMEALNDDLSTPKAYAELFALAKVVETASEENKARAKARLLAAANIMGLLQADPADWFSGGADEALKAKVEDLLQQRLDARRSRDFARADEIRAELDDLGVVVMDGAGGSTWRMKEPA